jgi:outer membrane protein TolC
MGLLQKSNEYSLSNASKGYLPQFTIAGQATYQSAVTQISIPDVIVTPLSKDQYRIYGEIDQPLTDLFTLKEQKEAIKANTAIEEQKIEVELYKLKERINSIFFGVILMDAQLEQNDLLKKDIQSTIEKTNTSLANGTATKTNVDLLKAELLKADQRAIELKAARKGYLEMLSLFINLKIQESTVLQKPEPQIFTTTINRLESKQYELQKKYYDVQSRLITAKNLPRFSLFFQGGYGRPTLNLLDNNFGTYYQTGLRLNWNLSGYYTSKKERQLLIINQNTLDVQNETFLFNTKLSMTQQNTDITRYQDLILTDNEIISLRERVKYVSKTQLENGIITTNDYLANVNAEDQAKQNLLLHQVQLLMAQYNYQTTTGN